MQLTGCRLAALTAAAVCVVSVLASAGCGAASGLPARGGSAAGARTSAGASTSASANTPGGSGTPGSTGKAASPRPSAGPASSPVTLPLAGKVVGIDPGHNGGNFDDPGYIDRLVWNGREYETCDTTGTETAGGYTEAQFNFNVASYLRADLIKDGAKVVMTRRSDDGVGPCVTTRAEIINEAHADVAIDIHADGAAPAGRGFTVLEPVADGPNENVIQASIRFGADVRAALLRYTSMPESDYYGHGGFILRDDLAGLNLTTVPKVLVECGNMPNPTDARLLTSPSFQRELAVAFTAAIIEFLTRR